MIEFMTKGYVDFTISEGIIINNECITSNSSSKNLDLEAEVS